jgi:hypothetical protein
MQQQHYRSISTPYLEIKHDRKKETKDQGGIYNELKDTSPNDSFKMA